MGLGKVQGLGCGFFWVQGSGLGLWSSGFRVWVEAFAVASCQLSRLWGLGFRVLV